MPRGETIADYLRGARAEKRTVRNDRWSKLMDVAGMGKGIWETLSGRKYATDTREDEQSHDTNKMLAGQAFSKSEAAQARAADAEQGLYGRAYGASQAALDRAAELQRANVAAGKSLSERQQNMQAAIMDAFEKAALVHGDWFIPNPNDPTSKMANPETIDKLRNNVLLALKAFKPTSDDMAVLEPYINDLLSFDAAALQPKQQVTQTPTFNPPPEAKPTKPAFADVTSLAQKLVKAKAIAGADPESKRVLDYIQAQMPTASNPRGGPDYSRNPIEWAAKASETVNRILGIVTPQNQTPSMKGMGNTLLK